MTSRPPPSSRRRGGCSRTATTDDNVSRPVVPARARQAPHGRHGRLSRPVRRGPPAVRGDEGPEHRPSIALLCSLVPGAVDDPVRAARTGPPGHRGRREPALVPAGPRGRRVPRRPGPGGDRVAPAGPGENSTTPPARARAGFSWPCPWTAGQTVAARHALAEADRALADDSGRVDPISLRPGWHWRNRLMAHVLNREAEPLRQDLSLPADPFQSDLDHPTRE